MGTKEKDTVVELEWECTGISPFKGHDYLGFSRTEPREFGRNRFNLSREQARSVLASLDAVRAFAKG